jgi:uncharacterized protein (TIGR02246 family)
MRRLPAPIVIQSNNRQTKLELFEISMSIAMTRRPVIYLLALALLIFHSYTLANAQRHQDSIAAIKAVIEAQRDAWNKGDIEGYMEGYEKSDNTVFVSGDNVTRGWKTVLERYKKSYDSREKMGQLEFSDLEITMLSKDSAVVLGRWLLKRSQDEPHGRFSLIFKKTASGWRIIHDHTSSA